MELAFVKLGWGFVWGSSWVLDWMRLRGGKCMTDPLYSWQDSGSDWLGVGENDPLGGGLGASDPEGSSSYWVHDRFDPHHPEGWVVGQPGQEMQVWHHQDRADDCGVVAQQFVIESVTGKSWSEDYLCHEAKALGGYAPGEGTPVEDLGQLVQMETHIPVERHFGGSLMEIEADLAQGERVIVAVNEQMVAMPDAGSILGGWDPSWVAGPANHAVEVIGVVHPFEDPLHPQVVINDPAMVDGAGVEIPAAQFEQAWAVGDHFMASTHGVGSGVSGLGGGEDLGGHGSLHVQGCSSAPWVEIRSTGNIFLHTPNGYGGELVGSVDHRKFYGDFHTYVGKLGTDWRIYDAHGDEIGYVDSCCKVHRPDGRVVYEAKTALGGAAWMLFVGMGGRH